MKVVFEKESDLGTMFKVEYSDLTGEYIVGLTDHEGNAVEDIFNHTELNNIINEIKKQLENE